MTSFLYNHIVKLNSDRRIINFRPCALGALLMCSAIFVATKVCNNLLFLIPTLIIPAMLLLYYGIKRQFLRLISFILIYAVGLSVAFANIFTYSNFYYNDKSGVIVGRVKNCNNYYEESSFITLQNVKFNYNGKTYSLAGTTSVSIYGYDTNTIDIGDKIAFEGKLRCVNILESLTANNYYYKQNIKYYTYANFDKTEVVDGELKLTEIIANKSKENLIKFMGEDNGAVAYAILFGDKTLVNDNISKAFRESGTAHLLAVSGLHVGFLITLLYFVIDRFRINKYVKVCIIAIILFIYSYICGFSPSVVRASIMGVVILLCKTINGRYDSLSSLGLACIIILLFRPLYLFDVGFQMSFTSVLGITLLYKFLDYLSIKNKLVKSLCASIWLTIVAQIGVLPIVASAFGTLATYSILANVIIVPIFGISYVILCVVNLLVLIFPFMNFLMLIVKGLFSFIIAFNNLIISAPYAYINVFGFGIVGSLIFYILLLNISRFVMIKSKIKIIICCTLSVICATILCVNNIPKKFVNDQIIFNQQSITSIVTTKQNNVLLINLDTNNILQAKETLLKNKINKIDILLFTTTKNFEPTRINEFLKTFDVRTFALPQNHPAINNLIYMGYEVIVIDEDGEMLEQDLQANIYTMDGSIIATNLNFNDKNIMYIQNNLEITKYENLQYIIDRKIDYLYILNETQNIYYPYLEAINYIDSSNKLKVSF